MYRVLLADDDMIVRMFLTDVVKWEEYGFEIVGTARDGEEALDMARNCQPDIILTDISMPCLDGVELIRRLRGEGYEGVIDVLSCHDDFALVKSAMKEGADDYLLKNHLNHRSIGEFLDKIRGQVEQRQVQSKQRREIRTLASKGMVVVRKELFTGILRGTLTGEQMEEQMQQAGLSGKYRRLITVLIRPMHANSSQMDALMNLCSQRLQNEPAEILPLHKDVLVLLLDLTDIPSEQQARELSDRLQNLIQRLSEQYLNLEIAMAGSMVCEGKTAVANALRQANDTLQNGFYGVGRWQYDLTEPMQSEIPVQARQFAEDLPDLLCRADDSTIQQRYADACEAIERARVQPGTVLLWLRECDSAAGLRRNEAQYSAMQQWNDYVNCVNDYLMKRAAGWQSKIPENVSPTIRRAAQYIQEHFSEQIGLEQVSRYIGLSSAYFSTLFKQEMGVGFSEYLLTVRLEWICDRICKPGHTIKQISEEAGFQDYSYFCKIFKRNIGVSPTVYRKQNG
ncbi:MAG: response regulator [Butyricicoccus sp.]